MRDRGVGASGCEAWLGRPLSPPNKEHALWCRSSVHMALRCLLMVFPFTLTKPETRPHGIRIGPCAPLPLLQLFPSRNAWLMQCSPAGQ